MLSPDGCDVVHSPSDVVVSMLEQFVELHQIGLAPEFLLTQIEDTLSDVLAKSLSLVSELGSFGIRLVMCSSMFRALGFFQFSVSAGSCSLSSIGTGTVRF